MISDAYIFEYSIPERASSAYHASPLLTPIPSATTSVRNDALRPMKSPTKMLGSAAGITTRKIR